MLRFAVRSSRIHTGLLRLAIFEEFHCNLGEQRVGENVLILLFPLLHLALQSRKLRLKQICRPAGNRVLLLVAQHLVHNLGVEGLYCLAILAEKNRPFVSFVATL